MQPSTADPRRRRVLILAGILAGLLAGVSVIRAATAPDEAEVCARVLDLAAGAGEDASEADRAACERHYAELRERSGWLEWARVARCTVTAQTLSDAGGCG